MKNRNKYLGVIYSVLNKITGQYYIGATGNSMHRRKLDHIERANRGETNKFHTAIATYGMDAFDWTQVDSASSKDELAQKEKSYIIKYDSKDNGFNSTSGGEIMNRSVYKYSLEDGELKGVYEGLQEAAETVDSYKQHISRACLSVNKTYNGFFWSYEYKDPFVPEIDKRRKKVVQFDSTGQMLGSYTSVSEAARQTGISKTCISRVCRNERDNTHGFVFVYK